jgi:glucokinase
VMLTLGTGIGGGLILDGRVYRGSRGVGAELGHMVVDLDGPECFGECPGQGCLEAVASGKAIARDAEAEARAAPESSLGRTLARGEEITALAVTAAAATGDAVAGRVLDQVGRRLGAGLAGLVNAFDPEVVVLGGGVMAAGELLLGPAREVVMETALPPLRERVSIVAAALAEEAGMVGAGILALERGEV